MIRYLIKNNFKLMFRNTWSVVVMLLGPVLVIAVLSSAFSELMKSYKGVGEFVVGYRMQEAAEDNVMIESAIILELPVFNSLEKKILAVVAPEELRLKRVMDRDKALKEMVLSRIRAQEKLWQILLYLQTKKGPL